MAKAHTEAVLNAAIALLVHDKPDAQEIAKSLESAALPAITELLDDSYFNVWAALSSLQKANFSDEDEESEASPEELAGRDWTTLERNLETARAEFSSDLGTGLNLINGFRRLRGIEEFAPKDTAELMQLLKMVLELPSDDERFRIGDHMGLGFEMEVRRADIPGMARATFEVPYPRYHEPREIYDYDQDDFPF